MVFMVNILGSGRRPGCVHLYLSVAKKTIDKEQENNGLHCELIHIDQSVRRLQSEEGLLSVCVR